MWYAVLIEHAIMLLRVISDTVAPTQPEWVRRSREVLEYKQSQMKTAEEAMRDAELLARQDARMLAPGSPSAGSPSAFRYNAKQFQDEARVRRASLAFGAAGGVGPETPTPGRPPGGRGALSPAAAMALAVDEVHPFRQWDTARGHTGPTHTTRVYRAGATARIKGLIARCRRGAGGGARGIGGRGGRRRHRAAAPALPAARPRPQRLARPR